MNVLVVTVVHDPQDARIRHRQIRALMDAGHHITFAAPFSAYERPRDDDLRTVDLPRAQGLNRLAAARAVRRLLKRRGREFDVVLLHDPELVLTTAGLSVPGLVWDVHEDTAAALQMKAWLPRPARPAAVMLIRAIERMAERRMPLILAEESYAERFTRPHPIVRNSVVVPERIPEPIGARDDRVIYIGRLTRARGALEMIELGRRLAPGVAVHLVGPADRDCADAVEDAHHAGIVHWHGFVPNDAALAMLPSALAGLSLLHDQPNYAHSLPTKIVEYMAHGVPVITTPNPSSAEIVRRHHCGSTVPFGDVDAAAEAIRALAADPAEQRRLATAGRTAAIEYYSWRTDAGVFVETLEKIATGSS